MPKSTPTIAIVDYGMGNLFSVQQACRHVGMNTVVTAAAKDISAANGIILPGVGAFGDAMNALKKLNLVDLIRSLCAAGRPLMGVCLGMQLLMDESFEFGRHEGLGVIRGSVIRFESPMNGQSPLKVPQVGWNKLFKPAKTVEWKGTPLDGLEEGAFMYFVHSYFVKPSSSAVVLSQSRYGEIDFCSTLLSKNIFACQYHPERSGESGLRIYRNFESFVRKSIKKESSYVD